MTVMEKIELHSYRDGDCLIWTASTNRTGVPSTNFWHGDKWQETSVRRAYCRENGIPFNRNHNIIASCGNPLCVAPEHYRILLRATHLKMNHNKMIKGSANVVRTIKGAETKRKNSKYGLTMEKVRRMRREQMTPKQAAEVFGISSSYAGKILRNKCWPDYSNPFAQLLF